MRIKSFCLALSFLVSFGQTIFASASSDTIKIGPNNDIKQNWFYLGTNKELQPNRKMEVTCDVAVIGGGMAGISAAVAAARQGAKVILINDRPVLGGNASSEIRITVNGATPKGSPNSLERETGIVEEILLENRKYNPQHSYPVWDHVLYNYVMNEPNITLMLNTQAIKAEMNGTHIVSAMCWQSDTETTIEIKAPIFIDSSGDGLFAATAGAKYRTGRESKAEFGEKFAPEKADGWMMGESIMMITKDMGRPVTFYPPSYTKKYDADKAKDRKIKNLKEGFWWVELGSNKDIIADRPKNRQDLMAYFYGVWDYVKNSGEFPQAANLALEWVGSLPGKRESRRFEGDYMLSETDMLAYKHFDDAVAWGGWSLDEHCPGGILSLDQRPSYFHDRFVKPYEIPFRCLYSKNIDNLFFAGRDASVSHMALSSTRIIGTCCMMGQAVGVASALCVKNKVNPRDIYNKYINELQETMLREDYYIPNRPAKDSNNLAKSAKKFYASSTSSGDVKNLLDGIARDENGENHHWQSKDSTAVLSLEWKKPINLSRVELKFDTNLHKPIMMHKDPIRNDAQVQGIPHELVKSFSVEALVNKKWVEVANVKDNIRRYVPLKFDAVKTTALRVKLNDTYGSQQIRLYELRCY